MMPTRPKSMTLRRRDQNAIEHDQRRPDQERTEDVGVLECAERAVEGREQIVGMRKQTEIAGNAGSRDDGRREHISASASVAMRAIVLCDEQAGEQHGRDGQIEPTWRRIGSFPFWPGTFISDISPPMFQTSNSMNSTAI